MRPVQWNLSKTVHSKTANGSVCTKIQIISDFKSKKAENNFYIDSVCLSKIS